MNTSVLRDPLLVWGLTTFHAAFFVLAAVFLLYQGGDMGQTLGSLNTLVGFGLFIALWLTTRFATHRQLRMLAARRLTPGRAIVAVLCGGAVWGAVNGVLFLLVLLVGSMLFAITDALAEGHPQQALAVLLLSPVYGGIASLVAATTGAAVGLLFGVVDGLVLLTARRLLPAAPAEPAGGAGATSAVSPQ